MTARWIIPLGCLAIACSDSPSSSADASVPTTKTERYSGVLDTPLMVNTQAPGALAVAGGFIYFTYNSGIAKIGPTDMQPTPLHSGFSWTSDFADTSLAVDDSCVFWTGLNGGSGVFAGPR